MCCRYVNKRSAFEIAKDFSAPPLADDSLGSYNIAPGQDILAVVGDMGQRRLKRMRWGLIPHWAKDKSIGKKLINARSETVSEKQSFRDSFRSMRCVIPADGFFEWRKLADRSVPYYIYLSSRQMMAMAGIYSKWKSPEGKTIVSLSIITTKANELVGKVHNRMPVIIARDEISGWLDVGQTGGDEVQKLMRPFDASAMSCHEVSGVVNNVRHDSAECIEPVLA